MPNYSVYHIEVVSKEDFNSKVNGIEKEIEDNKRILNKKIKTLHTYMDKLMAILGAYLLFNAIAFSVFVVISIILAVKYPDFKIIIPISMGIDIILGASIAMLHSIFKEASNLHIAMVTQDNTFKEFIISNLGEEVNEEVIPGEDEDWYGTKEDQD